MRYRRQRARISIEIVSQESIIMITRHKIKNTPSYHVQFQRPQKMFYIERVLQSDIYDKNDVRILLQQVQRWCANIALVFVSRYDYRYHRYFTTVTIVVSVTVLYHHHHHHDTENMAVVPFLWIGSLVLFPYIQTC